MSLTCLSCKLLFSLPEVHQEHYKTDWHRYNLKRRLADLPPLNKDDFERRAAAFKEESELKDKKVSSSCELCNKHFATNNAMISHLQSKKHKAIASASPVLKPKKAVHVPKTTTPVVINDGDDEEWSGDDGEDGDWEDCDDSDDEGMKKFVVDTGDCLFCDHHCELSTDNVTHMMEAHSFYIPDVEYLTDCDNLIACLATKIHLDQICIWCNGKGKGFRSAESVKKHMRDKGHCKMLYEGDALLDYADLYDYSSIDTTKEIGDVNVIDELLEDTDFELVLPSGATIGHRSLAVYYKQNLKPVSSDSQQKVKKVLHHYKMLGYTGATSPAEVKRARDISYMKRIKDRYHLKLGIKQNKFQPHFRPQVVF